MVEARPSRDDQKGSIVYMRKQLNPDVSPHMQSLVVANRITELFLKTYIQCKTLDDHEGHAFTSFVASKHVLCKSYYNTYVAGEKKYIKHAELDLDIKLALIAPVAAHVAPGPGATTQLPYKLSCEVGSFSLPRDGGSMNTQYQLIMSPDLWSKGSYHVSKALASTYCAGWGIKVLKDAGSDDTVPPTNGPTMTVAYNSVKVDSSKLVGLGFPILGMALAVPYLKLVPGLRQPALLDSADDDARHAHEKTEESCVELTRAQFACEVTPTPVSPVDDVVFARLIRFLASINHIHICICVCVCVYIFYRTRTHGYGWIAWI